MNSSFWVEIASTIIGPILLAFFGWWNRHWIKDIILPKIVLSQRNIWLLDQLKIANDTIRGQAQQVLAWRGAREADDALLRRVEHLEEEQNKLQPFVLKFDGALRHIQNMERYITGLISKLLLMDPNMEIPPAPIAPEEIMEDLAEIHLSHPTTIESRITKK